MPSWLVPNSFVTRSLSPTWRSIGDSFLGLLPSALVHGWIDEIEGTAGRSCRRHSLAARNGDLVARGSPAMPALLVLTGRRRLLSRLYSLVLGHRTSPFSAMSQTASPALVTRPRLC